MGKAKRKVPIVHSNHHDNPRRKSNGIVRRSHSQTASKKPGPLEAEGPRATAKRARPRVPFHKSDHVLCIGEGDFSFALSLAARHNLKRITATCYDDEETLHQKYPQAKQIILQLLSADPAIPEPFIASLREEDDPEWHGLSPPPSVLDITRVTPSGSPNAAKTLQSQNSIPSNSARSVHYAINATKLSSTHSKLLRTHSPFTKIVFNFPHVGGLSTDVNRQVRANQELLVGFFKAAIPLLASAERPVKTKGEHSGSSDQGYNDPDEDDDEDNIRELKSEKNEKTIVAKGQILVTLFEGEPYTLWNIRDLARHSGLKVVESFHFPWEAYPGYTHARTLGEIKSGKDRTAEGKRKGAWRGEDRDARCFMLEVKEDERINPRSRVGTEANNVDLGTRKRKRKGMAGGTESGSGSD